ncbi:MAG: DEAD/DEAH box helicase [Candidatus Methylumidiphilus sp.]
MARQVQHARFGLGSVLLDNGATQVVRFVHGIEEVPSAELDTRLSVREAIAVEAYASPLETILRIHAAAITSVNDAWGVFSRSRIALLPHQLWVCHRALRQWPVRLLIADDVGLGKTIEAGLILWPLLAAGVVRRLLILTPAALTAQWQTRMRQMFDIRLSLYHPEVDSERSDFWNTHQQVIASLPTLRADRNGRHERLLDAPTWDMVLVDEAHHLNADENRGKTLGFQLIEKLQEQQKIVSCILFTGTPHRGKPYGFWSLMGLLDSTVFGPQQPNSQQLQHLSDHLIRNCKQKVVDMQGNRLFQPISQYPETYSYSPEEADFYNLMTRFITSGRAYASTLDQQSQSQVVLVLIALQKLASSSVAAVRSALKTRQGRLHGLAIKPRHEQQVMDSEEEADDETNAALRQWALHESKRSIQLMENEIESLDELLESANQVVEETRIGRIVEIIEQRFAGEHVLLFTEYKTTQGLIVSALMQRFGEDTVGFINGDNRLQGVALPNGRETTLTGQRETTADRFNAGNIRFLVSTEAGGEGIDLQERCHCLIHADLPWNPMRLHQRVGRLNRYGQNHPVEVVSIRNPDTIESMIWTKLEHKLGMIMQALGSAMDEPEDLLQLVLGMTGSSFFNELFGLAGNLSKERLGQWFDEKAKTFGGKDALETVKTLVGHAQSFDLSGLNDVPRLDLPDLLPFFKGMLHYNNRRPEQDGDALHFKTPENWLNSPAIKKRYDGLVFRRDLQGKDAAANIAGVGHPVFEQALRQARDFSSQVTAIQGLPKPLFVFSVRDKVTTRGGQILSVIVGISFDQNDQMELLKDCEIVTRITQCIALCLKEKTPSNVKMNNSLENLECARTFLEKNLPSLRLPFAAPEIMDYSALLPLD